jgi:hypothetical protein
MFELVLEVHEITSCLQAKYSGDLRKRWPRAERGDDSEETGVFKPHPFSRMSLRLR